MPPDQSLPGRFVNGVARHPDDPAGELRDPGDYKVIWGGDGEPVALAFILPTGRRGRIAAIGHGEDGAPEWEIRIDGDGLVTVSPSINAEGDWHGHLEGGVWRA